jgi:hypothetical protein
MNIDQVVQELLAEQARIAKALEALEALRGSTGASQPQPKKHTMSASTRRKLSLAAKARWAKASSQPQVGATKRAARRKRKPMSEAVKARLRAVYAKNHPGWKPKKGWR